jgi:hypothetical protein
VNDHSVIGHLDPLVHQRMDGLTPRTVGETKKQNTIRFFAIG